MVQYGEDFGDAFPTEPRQFAGSITKCSSRRVVVDFGEHGAMRFTPHVDSGYGHRRGVLSSRSRMLHPRCSTPRFTRYLDPDGWVVAIDRKPAGTGLRPGGRVVVRYGDAFHAANPDEPREFLGIVKKCSSKRVWVEFEGDEEDMRFAVQGNE